MQASEAPSSLGSSAPPASDICPSLPKTASFVLSLAKADRTIRWHVLTDDRPATHAAKRAAGVGAVIHTCAIPQAVITSIDSYPSRTMLHYFESDMVLRRDNVIE